VKLIKKAWDSFRMKKV